MYDTPKCFVRVFSLSFSPSLDFGTEHFRNLRKKTTTQIQIISSHWTHNKQTHLNNEIDVAMYSHTRRSSLSSNKFKHFQHHISIYPISRYQPVQSPFIRWVQILFLFLIAWNLGLGRNIHTHQLTNEWSSKVSLMIALLWSSFWL